MTEPTNDLRNYIEVKRIAPDDSAWSMPSPFDLRFKGKSLSVNQKAEITGTGVYLISKGARVVYIGSYLPNSGKIIADRWGRHLQTITARGYNIGLGGTNPESRLADLKAAVDHPNLRQVLQAAYDHDGTLEAPQWFRDSGFTTTANRLRFASENWEMFGKATQDSVLNDIAFNLVLLPAAKPQAEIKVEGASDVKKVENQVLRQYQPCCNKEYIHAEHQHTQSNITVPNVLAAVRKAIKDVTRFDSISSVSLQWSRSPEV